MRQWQTVLYCWYAGYEGEGGISLEMLLRSNILADDRFAHDFAIQRAQHF